MAPSLWPLAYGPLPIAPTLPVGRTLAYSLLAYGPLAYGPWPLVPGLWPLAYQ